MVEDGVDNLVKKLSKSRLTDRNGSEDKVVVF